MNFSKSRIHSLILASFSLTTLACETMRSSDLETAGIVPVVEFLSAGDGTVEVRASLRAGGLASNTFLELTGGDRLVARSTDDQTSLMGTTGLSPYLLYVGFLQGGVPGTELSVSLLRERHENATDSAATLPANFEVLGFEGGSDGRGKPFIVGVDDLPVRWTNSSNDQISVSVQGVCVHSEFGAEQPDTGRLTLSAASLHSWEGRSGERCTGEVIVRRVRGGQVDRIFDEGRVTAVQERRMTVHFEVP